MRSYDEVRARPSINTAGTGRQPLVSTPGTVQAAQCSLRFEDSVNGIWTCFRLVSLPGDPHLSPTPSAFLSCPFSSGPVSALQRVEMQLVLPEHNYALRFI